MQLLIFDLTEMVVTDVTYHHRRFHDEIGPSQWLA